MAAQYTRVSPGRWRDSKTGKIINSTVDPNKKATTAAKPAAAAPAPTTPIRSDATTYTPDTVGTASGPIISDNRITQVDQGVEANRKVQDFNAAKNLQLNNPTQQNPYGKQVTTYDDKGNPTVTQTLSEGQQKISDQDTGISQFGRDVAQQLGNRYNFTQGFNPQLTARTSSGDLAANRARIEEAAYDRLTRRVDQQEAKEKEQLTQTLANRGIPLDPSNPSYQNFMKDFEDKYSTIRGNARQDAVAMGGQEYERDVGINETQRANDYSQQQGTRNQQIGEVGTFSRLGTGLQTPNFQGYQGTNYNLQSPTDINQSLQGINAAFEALKRRGGGGGGTGAPAPTSYFNTSSPPGLG